MPRSLLQVLPSPPAAPTACCHHRLLPSPPAPLTACCPHRLLPSPPAARTACCPHRLLPSKPTVLTAGERTDNRLASGRIDANRRRLQRRAKTRRRRSCRRVDLALRVECLQRRAGRAQLLWRAARSRRCRSAERQTRSGAEERRGCSRRGATCRSVSTRWQPAYIWWEFTPGPQIPGLRLA